MRVVGNLFLLALGVVILAAGASTLVRGGAAIGRRLGVSPLVIGLTVVAFGTSTPEMIVSVGGALEGRGDIALGNVVGSNIFNVGVVLALCALISPIRVELGLLRLDAPFMVAVSLVAVALGALPEMPRWGGLLLLVLLAGYTLASVKLARSTSDGQVDREFESGVPGPMRSLRGELLLIVGGLGLLFVGSHLLVRSAVAVARTVGVGEAVIGLTIVAAGTSMPELATSAVAAFRGHSDIAIGNVIGSNIFNVLGILGLASTLAPLRAPGIEDFDLWVMAAFSVGLLPLLWTGRRLHRLEGALLLVGYACYLWMRWPA
jgi:cation:H+ antiporter